MQSLFQAESGTFKYLSHMVGESKTNAYKLVPNDIPNAGETQNIYKKNGLEVLAHKVEHGPLPATAYIVKACGKTIVFTGDTNSEGFESLKLAKTDLLVAHNAIPEKSGRVENFLHMTPTKIGKLAKQLNTETLVLSHRMKRTLGKEAETQGLIEDHFKGEVVFADDLDTY